MNAWPPVLLIMSVSTSSEIAPRGSSTDAESWCMLAEIAPPPTAGSAFLKLLQAKPLAQAAASNGHTAQHSSSKIQNSSRPRAAAQSRAQPASATRVPSQPPVEYKGTENNTGGLTAATSTASFPKAQQPVPQQQRSSSQERPPAQWPANPNPVPTMPVEQLLQRWWQPSASQDAGSRAPQSGSLPGRQPPAAFLPQPAAPPPQAHGKNTSS